MGDGDEGEERRAKDGVNDPWPPKGSEESLAMWKLFLNTGLIIVVTIFGLSSISQAQGTQENPWDKVILRIDDGPSKYTAEILETLRALGIKNVIFNLVGKYIVEKNGSIRPEIAKVISDIIYKYHYEIGIHTFKHPDLHLEKVRKMYENDLKKWEKEIDNTQEAINLALKMMGKPPYYCEIFAAPGGPQNLSPKLKNVIKAKSLEIDKGWDIDSRDSIRKRKRLSPQEIATQIKILSQHKSKITVLIHDRKGGWTEALKTIDRLLKYGETTIPQPLMGRIRWKPLKVGKVHFLYQL